MYTILKFVSCLALAAAAIMLARWGDPAWIGQAGSLLCQQENED